MSPIHVQAKLNDQHLEVLGPKSPPRRRYAEVGLEGTDESDYIPTRNDRRQGHPTKCEDQLQGGPRAIEPFGTDLPPTDPTIRLLLQKFNRIEEEQNQTRTPAWGKVQLGPFTSRIDSTDLRKRYKPSESHFTQEWRTPSPTSIHFNRPWVARGSPTKANANCSHLTWQGQPSIGFIDWNQVR
ncbi:unnamed protein product [Prunus brigantina]